MVPSLMPPFDALVFVVLGVTKHAVSGIRNGRAHSIQTRSSCLARYVGLHQRAVLASTDVVAWLA
jgi:hypothetical protein